MNYLKHLLYCITVIIENMCYFAIPILAYPIWIILSILIWGLLNNIQFYDFGYYLGIFLISTISTFGSIIILFIFIIGICTIMPSLIFYLISNKLMKPTISYLRNNILNKFITLNKINIKFKYLAIIILNLLFGYMLFDTISSLFSNGDDSYIKIFLESINYLTMNDLQSSFLNSQFYNNYHIISLIVFEILTLLATLKQCILLTRNHDINLRTISLNNDKFEKQTYNL